MSHCWPVMGVSVLDRSLPRETLHPVGIRAKGPLPQANGKAPAGVRQVLGEGQGHDLAGEAGGRATSRSPSSQLHVALAPHPQCRPILEPPCLPTALRLGSASPCSPCKGFSLLCSLSQRGSLVAGALPAPHCASRS